jgi:hypothetical protein
MLAVAGALGDASVSANANSTQMPEVKLVRIVSEVVEPRDLSEYSHEQLLLGNIAPDQALRTMEFEIHSPVETGFVLSRTDVKVEVAGPDPRWTEVVFPSRSELPLPIFRSLTTQRGIEITIPADALNCRFTFDCRPLTVRERCSQVLEGLGFWRSFPGFSAWVCNRLPDTERWTECQREVELPRLSFK